MVHSSRCIIKTATVAAAALAVATNSVTALQPRKLLQSQTATASRTPTTTTSLDYAAGFAVIPEPETQTSSDTTRKLEELEKLLRLELAMEQQMPQQVGVSPGKSSKSPPLLSTSTPTKVKVKKVKSTTKSNHKKRVIKRRLKTTTASSQQAAKESTTTTATATASRLRRTKRVKKSDSVYWWKRNAASKQPLLTRENEIEATDRIRALRRAEHVRDEHLHDRTPLTEQQWATACGLGSPMELRKVIRQGQEARSLLVQANMGLVTAIAKRLHQSLKQATEAGNGVGTILTLQDFLQEGQIGLIKAAERFDASRGVRFSTYATWWIRQRIQRSISDSSRIIRLPAHVHSKLMKIRKAKKIMQQQIGREPSEPELAHYLEMPVEKLRQYTKSSINVVSLENPLRPTNHGKGDVDTRTLGDTIASDIPTPLEDAQDESLRQDLEQVLLDALTPIERAVMVARYGLEDGQAKSLEETSRAVGVSRERVRLVEAKALNKLRSPQTNYRLKTYLGGSSSSRVEKQALSPTVDIRARSAQQLESVSSRVVARNDAKNNANPFAMPFEYGSIGQPKDKEVELCEENASLASSGADRLWFL